VTGLITERGVIPATREGLAQAFPERAEANPTLVGSAPASQVTSKALVSEKARTFRRCAASRPKSLIFHK